MLIRKTWIEQAIQHQTKANQPTKKANQKQIKRQGKSFFFVQFSSDDIKFLEFNFSIAKKIESKIKCGHIA
jgi:hypothetical protein